RLVMASARPRQSYPAPRFAEDPGTSTVTLLPSSSASQCPAISAPYQPSATATEPTVASASRNGGTWRSAVAGSLRPCPVRTHTTVAPGSISPAAAAFVTPATP